MKGISNAGKEKAELRSKIKIPIERTDSDALFVMLKVRIVVILSVGSHGTIRKLGRLKQFGGLTAQDLRCRACMRREVSKLFSSSGEKDLLGTMCALVALT